LKVNFDLSFPHIACNLLALDAVDESGIPQKGVVHDIYKRKLTSGGLAVGLASKHHELGNGLLSEKDVEDLHKDMDSSSGSSSSSSSSGGSGSDGGSGEGGVEAAAVGGCGNCYGAGDVGECCNTCDDVRRAYDRKGWLFQSQGISQCATENKRTTLRDGSAVDGGCQIYGHLELSMAAGGHFHIVPHKRLHSADGSKVPGGLMNLLDLIFFTYDQFNITHKVNSLRFGDNFPGITSPLDGRYRQLEDKHGMYQYYIKIVPTRYKGLNGKEIVSNQYAVTEHMRHLSPGSGKALPGLYFFYEVSPVQAVFEERRVRRPLSFLTSVCAIVGGAFQVMGIVDLAFVSFQKVFKGELIR
jgi:hypothetical protein